MFVMMLTAGMLDGIINAMFKTSLWLFGCVFVFGLCPLCIFKYKNDIREASVGILSQSTVIVAVLASLFCIIILPLLYPPMWV